MKRPGQAIDLGGIGKGYAADRIIEVFRGFGITFACTDPGGNVAVLGAKPDGSCWSVGIRHPRIGGRLLGAVSVAGKAVVTSGDYQRFFIAGDGRRYHHILDTGTGYPSEKGLISATVVAGSSLTADALSTIVFLSGIERGLELLETFPGTEAILVDTDLNVDITGGLTGCFQAAEDIYKTALKGE